MSTEEKLKQFFKGFGWIKRVVLFGSYARGEATEESDIDICVIAELNGKRKLDLIRDIRKRLIPVITAGFDILIYTPEEFDQRARVENSLEFIISREGRVIYEQK